MKNNNSSVGIIIGILLILIGFTLIKDYIDLKNMYEDTVNTIFDPITELVNNIENPDSFFSTFNPDEYLENSTKQVALSTFEAIRYRMSLPSGITAIITGFIALFYREKTSEFFIRAFRFLV